MIRVPTVGEEAGGSLSQTADAVEAALKKANFGKFEVAGTEIVGPIVGEQLTRQGTLATVLALGGILIYIAMRFQFSFAVGAVVATIHDLLVTLRVPGLLPLRPVAERHRRDPDDHRLLGQRHDRHLRPRAREHARHAARQPRAHRQRRGQPDAGPHRHHRRHGAPQRVLRCSCSAAKCCMASPSRCSSASSPARTRASSSRPRSSLIWQGQEAGEGHGGRRRRPRRAPARKTDAPPRLVGRARSATVLTAALLGVIQGLTEFLPGLLDRAPAHRRAAASASRIPAASSPS